MTAPRCETGKACYPSAASARFALGSRLANPAKRVYRCALCGHYHLTKRRPPFRKKRRPGQGYS